MKRLRRIALVVACMAASYVSAQDIIVKKDGTLIQAKVTKVGTSEVEYKKWDDQDGPQYSIAVADVLAINYKSGKKETFENVGANGAVQSAKGETEGQQTITQVKPEDLSPDAKAANDALIAKYNAPVELNVKKKYQKEIGKKKANRGLVCIQVAQNSILSNDDIEVNCKIGMLYKSSKNTPAVWKPTAYYIYYVAENPAILFSIKNKTNQTIYLDLANTFYVTMGQSTCYYIPSSTTSSHSASGGGSINLGAVTGALGIGGAAGTLANGVNIGGGSSNTTTNTTYSQRIVAIAPLSTIELSPQYLLCNEEKGISKGLKYKLLSSVISYDYYVSANFSSKSQSGPIMFGDNYSYSFENSPVKMSFYVAYSTSEQCAKENVLQSHYYLSNMLGSRYKNSIHELAGDLTNEDILQFGVHVTNKDGESFPKQ